jgi:hypothetical protein
MRALAIVPMLAAATIANAGTAVDFTARLRAAAADYVTWTRVDERPNLAPILCRAPLPGDEGVASKIARSAAKAGPHGTKLYYLWANDKDAYARRDRAIPARCHHLAVPVL